MTNEVRWIYLLDMFEICLRYWYGQFRVLIFFWIWGALNRIIFKKLTFSSVKIRFLKTNFWRCQIQSNCHFHIVNHCQKMLKTSILKLEEIFHLSGFIWLLPDVFFDVASSLLGPVNDGVEVFDREGNVFNGVAVLNQMKTHLVSLFRFRLVTVISNVQVKLNSDLSFSM